MHPRRRKAIERRMRRGKSFTAANNATKLVFDTVGWGEVVSRLARAKGMVCGIAQVIARGGIPDLGEEFWKKLRALATEIRAEASKLRKLLQLPSSRTQPSSTFEPSKEAYSSMQRISSAFALGQLRAAADTFLGKCGRHARFIETEGGAPLTEAQRDKIIGHMRWIAHGTRELFDACRWIGGYESLIQAKKLADAMGGVEKAKAAMDVLARLI